MAVYDTDPPVIAIAAGLISANEADTNGEPANVVDGLFAIARSINHLAAVISDLRLGDSIDHVAEAAARIAHGGDDEPTGLEALSMAVNGGRAGDNWPSLRGAITELAAAIRYGQS